MPLISLIIPVYKVEPYLRQCVDSVLNHHFSDMEIILVDDGSPDGCPGICDEYAQKNIFIRVIHKSNGGLSSARNAGIAAANGKYLMFLDSDDWWNKDTYIGEIVEIVKKHSEAEMFCFSAINYIPNVGMVVRKDAIFFEEYEGIHTRDEYYQKLILCGNLQESACTKIFSRHFLITNNLYFQEGITGEDTEWMFRVLRNANKILVMNIPLFVCRYAREGSISNSISIKNVKDALTVISQSVNFYTSNKGNEVVKSCELSQCAYLWFIVLSMYSGLKKEERREIRVEIKKYSYIAQNANSFKVKLSRVVLRLFGLELTAKILGIYVRLRKSNFIKKGKKYNYE